VDSNSASSGTLAVTQPDWNSVDFNSPELKDAEITDKDISVRGNDRLTIYSLGENILFAPGQSSLQGTADQKLRQIMSSIKKRHKSAVIGIYGNTDSTGTTSQNKQLGAERAEAVKDWLEKTGGVDSDKLSVRSYGESQPIADNSTEGGRKQNRNVQIVVFAGNDENK
jgi:outer membrane protein OmpA-like peptidoglycan-associated protein